MFEQQSEWEKFGFNLKIIVLSDITEENNAYLSNLKNEFHVPGCNQVRDNNMVGSM